MSFFLCTSFMTCRMPRLGRPMSCLQEYFEVINPTVGSLMIPRASINGYNYENYVHTF